MSISDFYVSEYLAQQFSVTLSSRKQILHLKLISFISISSCTTGNHAALATVLAVSVCTVTIEKQTITRITFEMEEQV